MDKETVDHIMAYNSGIDLLHNFINRQVVTELNR